MFDVPVDNGKYRFVHRDDRHGVEVLRHDEPWMTIERGSKAVITMACEEVPEVKHLPVFQPGNDPRKDWPRWSGMSWRRRTASTVAST